MANFSVNGLTSGINYGQLIDELVKVRQRPVDGIKADKTDYQSTIAAYDTLDSKLSTLQSAVDKLRKQSSFDVKTADVQDDTVFTASASSSAISGNYSISAISQLAQAHKVTNVAGKSLADKDTTTVLSSGQIFKFSVTVSGTVETTTVTASSNLTLEGLATEVNSSLSATNSLKTVTATIINDGNASTPYRLVLTSETSGSTGGITINQDDSTLDLDNSGGSGGVTTLQTAQDASFKVDGLSITKTSNTVDDVIGGVTFVLKKAPGGTTAYALTVKNDVSTIKSNIKTVVDSYNEVINHVNSESTYDSDKNKGKPLFNESTATGVVRRLRSIVTKATSGLAEDTKVLAQVGVSTNRDGTLTLDETKLGDKLTNDYSDVKALFIDDTTTSVSGVAKQMYDLIHDKLIHFVDGSVTIRKKGIQKIVDKYAKRITLEESRLSEYRTVLEKRFAILETLMTQLKSQGDFISSRLR